jgi:hypothetical protein
MGTNPRYYNPNLKDSRVSPVTLLAWGNRDKEEYTRGGLKPHRVVVVGSLMRALAFNSMKDMGGKYKPWDVCVVSQFRPKANPKSGVSESAIAEFTSMPLLLTLLSPILEKHKLRVVVALRSEKRLSSQISVTDERECFFRYLSCPFAFSDSNDLYSSYSAILNSRLTVGRNSGIMFECMSSDSRMLFVNPTTYKLFDPPTRWPFGLINPTSQQLETEIENLLLMPQERYQSARASIPEYFCLEAIDTLAAIRGVLLDSEARL